MIKRDEKGAIKIAVGLTLLFTAAIIVGHHANIFPKPKYGHGVHSWWPSARFEKPENI